MESSAFRRHPLTPGNIDQFLCSELPIRLYNYIRTTEGNSWRRYITRVDLVSRPEDRSHKWGTANPSKRSLICCHMGEEC